MRATFRQATRRSLALPLVALLAACAADQEAPADSALARDLALAAGGTAPSATPDVVPADTALGDATPAPAAPTPMPAPAPAAPRPSLTPTTVARAPRPAPAPTPAPVVEAPAPAAAPSPAAAPAVARGTRTLGVNTSFAVTTQSAVCASQHRPGDKIIARVASDVASPDGVAIPSGSLVVLEVAEASADARSAAVRFVVRSVGVSDSTYAVAAEGEPQSELARERQQVTQGNTAGRTARGAVIGAVLGQVLGGDTKATVGGAAAGAVIGAATSSRGKVAWEGCLPAGGTVTVRLTEPLTVLAP